MEIKHAIDALSALAQDTRLQIFRLLVRAGTCGASAGVIGEALNVPAPTLSFHLKLLCTAGLIDSKREGRSIIYKVNFEGMRGLLDFLMEDCCQGNPQLCATSEDCISCES